MKKSTQVPTFIRRFSADTRGSILMLVGLSITFLTAIGGAAVDLGKRELVHIMLQHASDAAATSAASMDGDPTPATRDAIARRYYALNFPDSYLGVDRPPPIVDIGEDSISVGTTGVPVPTNFVSNFGIAHLGTGSLTTVNFSGSGQRADVILVLDVSTSMNIADAGDGMTRITALVNAANNFTNSLIPVGMETDGGHGNRMAVIAWAGSVVGQLGFTSNNATAHGFINSLPSMTSGNTDSTTGLNAALARSSEFRGDDTAHIVVFMTDGLNRSSGGSYRYTPAINAASLTVASVMKAADTIIYTVGFGSDMIPNHCAPWLPSGTIGQERTTGCEMASTTCVSDIRAEEDDFPFAGSGDAVRTNLECGGYYTVCGISASIVDARGFYPSLVSGHPETFHLTDPLVCPTPFLSTMASSPDMAYMADDADALDAAFAAIVDGVKHIRIVH